MPEKEQHLVRQHEMEPRALKGINRLIQANRQNGRIDDHQAPVLIDGLKALADLPDADFRRIAQEQSEQRSRKGRFA